MAGTHEFYNGEGPAWLTKQKGDSLEVISEDDWFKLIGQDS